LHLLFAPDVNRGALQESFEAGFWDIGFRILENQMAKI
jgi:hypothetical protein